MNGVNRLVLLVLGVAALLAGAAVLLVNTGLLGRLLDRAGTGLVQPSSSDPMLPTGTTSAPTTVVLVGCLVGGLAVAGLVLWWLLAQRPRRTITSDFRLHADADAGSTVVTPAALDQAVRWQVEQLPGVVSAKVSVTGAVQAPSLQVRVTVDDRADVSEVLGKITGEVTSGIAVALDSTVDRLGVLVDIGHKRYNAQVATVPPDRSGALG